MAGMHMGRLSFRHGERNVDAEVFIVDGEYRTPHDGIKVDGEVDADTLGIIQARAQAYADKYNGNDNPPW